MKKMFLVIFLVFLTLIPLLLFYVKADELEDITSQLETLKKDLSSKEANHQHLTIKLNDLKNRVALLDDQIVKKEEEVKKGEDALVYQKNLLNVRAKSYYKNINNSSMGIINIMVGENLSESLRKFFYQKSLVDDDKRTIIKVVVYIRNLEEIKKNLEDEKTKTAYLKQEIDNQAKILAGQISQTRNQIAQLSARQQQLIAAKLASLGISRSASTLGRCDSDLTNGRDPGFSPKFAFFTYGVPNRVGMNQYGAKGRADRGENNEENILRAYYNFDNIETKNNIQIRVDGYDSYDLEVYLKGIHEMPTSFPAAALRAQAIAARSYALAYTNNGSGSICSTEYCQVFNPPGDRNDAWTQAVNDTSGKVMVQGGNPIKAWFSSTHGGYVFSSGEIGWSGTSWTKHANDFDGSVGSFSDLASKAYDRDSPWFYCDWGSRGEYNKTAWLKPQELADVINIILLIKNDSSTRDHLYQPDKSNPAGTDTWDFEKVKSELKNRGISPFSTVSDGSVGADFGSGRSTSVNFSGDGGNVSFSASEFKDWFNLRAPANIQIVGPLFNIEKR